MLIYNDELSVCPLTTHMPIKFVAKKISKNALIEKVKLINDFYVRKIGFKRWKLIHKVGANYIAFIFAFTYLGRLTKEEFSSVEFNLLFSIIIGAFALRVLYFF